VEIILTLQPAGVPAVEVRIRAAPGTPLGAVGAALGRVAGRPGAALYAGSRRLPADAVLGGAGLRCGDVLGVGAPGPRWPDPVGPLELRVTGGPDSGGIHPLPRGEFVVGRAASADVRIHDPDVSRRHAVVAVSAAGVSVRDLGSTNGTRADGVPVGPEPVPFLVDQRLRIGESTLALAAPNEPPASVRAADDGTIAVHRPPRLAPPWADVEVEIPAEPPGTERIGLPMFSSLIPVATAVLAGVFLHNGLFAMLGILSATLVVAGAWLQRRGQRRRRARDLATYRQALARAEAALASALAEEVRLRRSVDPDPAAVRRAACGPAYRIWERRPADPDFCHVRLGTADLPARVRRRSAGGAAGRPETAVSVPVTVALPAVGALGLAGPRRPVGAVARFVLAALATLHGPNDLAVVLLAGRSGADEWAWARWLPHLADETGRRLRRVGLTAEDQGELVAELIRQMEGRQAQRVGPSGWRGPCTVTVLDRWSELRQLPGLGRLLADGPSVGMFAVCIDATPHLLPAGCGGVVEVTGEIGSRLRIRVSGEPALEDVVADGVSQAWSEAVARALAPLRDQGVDTACSLPASCRLLDVLELEPPEPEKVLGRWDRDGQSSYAPIGACADGQFGLDLNHDGPHALVAGTTGAGKSELLQTLIASLAVANRPDAMTFVLIDYKGGAAFTDCTHLPHTIGMVTDLDTHLTERALHSLNAELKRREHLLATHHAKDIDDYRHTLHHHPTPDPLPRLVLVIDEFATLIDELPDFITGLLGIAMRGRSLGVHLILATQRPSGVVSPVIRANTNLRIALRVTDDTESTDVIDAPHAARISKTTPGRGYLRVPGDAPIAFQAARVGGRAIRSTLGPPIVAPAPWRTLGSPQPPVNQAAEEGPTDLQRLVSAISSAAAIRGLTAPPSPWLPPLPALLTLDDLRPVSGILGGASASAAVGAGAPAERPLVPLGLADHPAEQRQEIFGLDLADGGSLLIVGGPRSGRSTALRTLAAAVARRWQVDDVHLYAIDCGSGALHQVADLPHCGVVVRRDEVARGERVLALLHGEVRQRQELLARAGFGSVAEQRAAADAPDRLPWLLLLVDGWEGLAAGYEAVDHGRPVSTLLGLAREGPAVGLKLAVTSDRQGLLSRLGAAFPEKLLLRLTDRLDYGLAGIPARAVPDTMPAGRGLLATGAVEVQVAVLDRQPGGPAQAAALAAVAGAATERAEAHPVRRRPFRVRPLPRLVRLADLMHQAGIGRCSGPADGTGEHAARIVLPAAKSPFWTLLGAGGDDAGPVGVDLARDGPGFLLAGPRRSGRSSALVTLACGLRATGTPVVLVAPARSPLGSSAARIGASRVLGPADAQALSAALAQDPVAVLVDDVTRLADTPVDQALVELLRSGGDGHVVVVAGSNDELATTFRGTAAEVRRSRAGLLLCPSWTDGELLGARLPRGDPETVPGRGVLIGCDRQIPVQVAVADADPAAGREPA
jgi:S-DNA-T family DNA segregation ATPase FtsK/SpoIIIE